MNRKAPHLFAFSLLFVHFIYGQSPITYTLGLDNIHHHELTIEVTFENLETSELEIRMPNASPGRYAEHNFAKNVYAEIAVDKNEKPLRVKRLTPFSWKLETQKGYVKFRYTLYGNHGDGTYTGIDARKLHLNMPATFIYGVGLNNRPIRLKIDLESHPEWTVATQLKDEGSGTYTAPDYYYFYDSPTMVGDISWREWKVDDQTIQIAMLHEGTPDELDQYTDWVQRIVREEARIYGELPDFDFGRYTFLMAYNPWVYGDGMEHRNSTICSSTGSLERNAGQMIGTVAHEFFHAWNVERIRPASLEPFDFDRPNMSGALWFAEGFTSYYDDLVLCRTGIRSWEQYVAGLTGTMNYVINSPARAIKTPIQMSQNAPFADAATANDETNFANTFVSYYSYGAVLGLGLDLLLRSSFEELTLDDYMQYVWEHYGRSEDPYEISDLQESLARVTGDKKFAASYFNSYIYQSDLPDFKKLLNEFGVRQELVSEAGVHFGNVNLNDKGVLTSPIVRGTALYEAGMEKGDVLMKIGDFEVSSNAAFTKALEQLVVGRKYTITYKQMGIVRTGTFEAIQTPGFQLNLIPDAELDPETIDRRKKWLSGSK